MCCVACVYWTSVLLITSLPLFLERLFLNFFLLHLFHFNQKIDKEQQVDASTLEVWLLTTPKRQSTFITTIKEVIDSSLLDDEYERALWGEWGSYHLIKLSTLLVAHNATATSPPRSNSTLKVTSQAHHYLPVLQGDTSEFSFSSNTEDASCSL